MANYSEEFLNALSRTAGSLTGLMETIKEPDWREKMAYESQLSTKSQIAVLKATGKEERQTIGFEDELQYGSREHQAALNIDQTEFETRMEKGLLDFKSNLNKEEAKLAHNLLIKQATHKHGLSKEENEQLSKLKRKEYEAARDADFEYHAGDFKFRMYGIGTKTGVMNLEQSQRERMLGLETEYERSLMTAGSDLRKGESEFEHNLNRDSELLTNYLLKGELGYRHKLDMQRLDQTHRTDVELEALRSVLNMERMHLDANLKNQLLNQERMYAYEEAGYMATSGLGDVDFTDVRSPVDTWFGNYESQGAQEARAQFSGMLSLYHTQIPGALKAKVVNPDSYAVKEAIRDAEKAAETAINLYNFAKDEGYDDDAKYYANAIEHLRTQKERLEQ
jgi:hypothetical protein